MDIWEKGNVGITDLSGKLHHCLKQTLCDYILELYFLPQPIARIDDMSMTFSDSPVEAVDSPFVVLEPVPELKETDPQSPQRPLFEKGEVRVPSSLGFTPQKSLDSPLSPDTPVKGEPHRSRTDTYTITQAMDDILNNERNEVSGKEQTIESSNLTWQEKEKNRREIEAYDAHQKRAFHGRHGVLENTYSDLIPKHLMETCKLSSRSVSHYTFPLLGSYSGEVFLNEAIGICNQLCPDLTLNAFTLDVNGEYFHYGLQKTSRQRTMGTVSDTEFIVVGRNLKQWDEARAPDSKEVRLTQVLQN